MKEKVATGQFVPVGGMWVESDTNMPGGEALARQLVHGKRYFLDKLGIETDEVWLPDSFGYTAALPQLVKLSRTTWFLTQKISWSQFNRFPHHSFWWEGLDGTRVFTHFPPVDTYNSELSGAEMAHLVRNFADKGVANRSLVPFGYGDGGGGPTREMLETLRRAADLQGLPRTAQRTSEEFFDALEAGGGDRPVVTGELYFEYHRGVYTSQARTKRGNRRGERALHDAEFLSCLAAGYPRDELDRLWKLLLLQQFHDILPGSSIRLVYEDAERDLAAVEAGADALAGTGETLANTVGFARREVVGDSLYAAAPFGAARVVEPDDAVRVDGLTLENAHLRVMLSADGAVESVLHKASGRESLAARGNVLELYDDRPVAFDAWDIDPSALETRREYAPATSWRASSTPLRAEIAFERPGLSQIVRLDAGARRVEFHTSIDWQEEHTLLKVCFPLAVHARNATYEMPFGHAERPTHRSTSWDRARYEVPGHRWADLSEHGFGVALLNDCKYGWSCLGSELRLSLLRSPRMPDPEADVGRHEFAYALMPHAGGWREAGVVGEATCFNALLRWTSAPVPESFASVDDPNLVLDTIKRAEDSDALVLRLYEAHGARGLARLRVAAPFSSARRANVLEDHGEALEIEGDAVLLPYRPHQILTVMLV
jgi:alpha-mannosidase